MKQSPWLNILFLFVLIPATLFLGRSIPGRWYYLTSTLVIVEIMVPFFVSFERRRPEARELVIVGVMAALAAASRVAFAVMPYLKVITGIIMITGIAFGSQAGFLTGAIAAFASNFFFGQGPWTPWQMFAYGFSGFWAGLVFHGHPSWRKPWVLGRFGFFSILLLVGPMLDSCTVFTVLPKLSLANVLLIYGQGVPVNTIHGLGCGLTLLVLTKPLLQKLSRIQRKYGILEDRQ